MRKQVIYLAGGMKSDWRDTFMEDVGDHFEYIDPKSKEYTEKNLGLNACVSWDLQHIRRCDVLFAFIEEDNPSCIGLSAEIGFAKGLGKTVVCVIEPNRHISDRYLDFLRGVADLVIPDIIDAILHFKEYK